MDFLQSDHAGETAPGDRAPQEHAAPEMAREITPAAESADAATSGITPDVVKVALRRVKDPELNLNIVDLGLVYDVVVEGSDVRIDMSLTSPGCPSGPEILGDAEREAKTVEGIGAVTVNLIWSPPWTPERIEPRVRTYLGF